MQRLRVLIAAATAATLTATLPALPAEPAAPAHVDPGGSFPLLKLQAVRSGAAEPSRLDLGAIVGKKPVVVCYIALGEPFGEQALTGLQEKARGSWKATVEVLGALRPSGGAGPAEVHERLAHLGIDLPVVIDSDFALGKALGVTTSPSFSLVDKGGTLRVADARSLRQVLPPASTLAEMIDTAARGGAVPTVTVIPRYYPANDLVGEPFPDFMLRQFETGTQVRLSDRVAATQGKKMVALFFWHPNCKHCKQSMPGIVAGWQAYKQYIDLISVVALKNADEAVNARDTIRAHNMTFPILEDEDRRVSELYRVVSTPTMFFIRPDGKVESVYLKGDINYVPVFSAKLRSILGVQSRLSGSRPKSKP